MTRLRVPFLMHRTGWLLVLICLALGVGMGGWQFGLLEGALFLCSLLLHEAGHILAAVTLGVPVREFGLELRGAYIRRAHSTRRRDEVLIAASGPLMNLLIVAPLMYIPHIGTQLAICNLMLGVINLLPLPSSDGQRILRNLSGPVLARETSPALRRVETR